MVTILVLSAIVLFVIYFLVQARQKKKVFDDFVFMEVNYLFQDRPGQYSGDYRTKSGVFVFRSERKDEELRNIVIKQVKPDHPALVVNLEQIVVIPFENKKGDFDVSVRFKILRKRGEIGELQGKGIRVAGVLNFAKKKPKNFSVLLKIGEVYQPKEILG